MNINICMALNKVYLRPTTVAMYSICSNASDDALFSFYLLHKGLTFEDKEYIQSKLEVFKDKYSIQYVDIPDQYYAKLTCISMYGKEVWYRIFVPILLPQLDKILYLDGDIIVLGDLSELYNLDINSRAYAAVSEKNLILWTCNPIIYSRQHFRFRFYDKIGMNILDDQINYANSGVLLINCEYWRQNNYIEKILDFANTHKDDSDYRFPDQDAINWVALNDSTSNVQYLSTKFNFFAGFLKYKNVTIHDTILKMFRVHQEYEVGWKPVILHFAGIKPWIGVKYTEVKLYREYANKIDWHISKYKINTKYYLSRFVKMCIPNGILGKLTN